MRRIALCTLLFFSIDLVADSIPAPVARLIDQSTIAVVRIDAAALDPDRLIAAAAAESGRPVAELAERVNPQFEFFRIYRQRFLDAGGRELWVVVNLAAGPVLVMPLAGDADRKTIAELLAGDVIERDDALLMTVMQPDLLDIIRPADRPALNAGLNATSDAALRAAVALPDDPDARKAFLETMVPPPLRPHIMQQVQQFFPAFADSLKTGLLRETLRQTEWIALSADWPGGDTLNVTAQFDNAAAAQEAVAFAEKLRADAARSPQINSIIPQWPQLLPLLTPRADGSRVIVEPSDPKKWRSLTAGADALLNTWARLTHDAWLARDASQINKIVNAMYVYAMTHRRDFPKHIGELFTEKDSIRTKDLVSPLSLNRQPPQYTPGTPRPADVYRFGDYIIVHADKVGGHAGIGWFILSAEPLGPNGARNVGYADGSVRRFPDPESFHAELQRQNQQRAEKGLPPIDLENLP